MLMPSNYEFSFVFVFFCLHLYYHVLRCLIRFCDIRNTILFKLNEIQYRLNGFMFDTWCSFRSEVGAGGLQKTVRSRALSIQSSFRRNSLWIFFQLDQMIKSALFFQQLRRRQHGVVTGDAPDNFAKCYGTVVPAHIPDSTAW